MTGENGALWECPKSWTEIMSFWIKQMVVDEHSMRCLATTICLELCLCVTPLMFVPFDPFRGFTPNQFEPAATVAINRHSKQALGLRTFSWR